MKLHDLNDNEGARHARKRVGRGYGSGLGKTAGRGQKGQKSRSGVAIKGFEGGQMPIHMRVPKRGFKNVNAKDYAVINLGRLQAAVDAGKLKAGESHDFASLRGLGIVGKAKDGLRLLGHGELSVALRLTVTGVTGAARAAVEAAGGSVTVLDVKPIRAMRSKPE